MTDLTASDNKPPRVDEIYDKATKRKSSTQYELVCTDPDPDHPKECTPFKSGFASFSSKPSSYVILGLHKDLNWPRQVRVLFNSRLV